MNRFTTAFARFRAERAALSQEREFRQIIAAAPTREGAHELASLFAHR
jgi:hypothetical protein